MESVARPFLFLCFALFLLSSPCRSDPDPLQDFCVANPQTSDVTVNGFPCKPTSSIVSDDFFSTALSKAGSTDNIFSSNVTAADVLSFPGLNTLGLSMNRVDIAPGGVNPPHTHPRATQLGLVLHGQVLVGIISTSNVFYSKILNAGESFVIPRGLVHFEYNMGKEAALEITAFNSQLPGVLIAPRTLFGSMPGIPSEVLAKTFQVDQQVVNLIKSKFGN
ncbi:germin-like protein 3-8 [Phoenix dactylifera]|uniref:Germin-like protein n=1 Tax=Phoenix dactylifera TaxID=42345 RepID=A0A8B8ZZQ6_PHODC|nr:germin-like protein 3-8 [Phoenix dactylifera]XP_038978857.1 germin-like protein 3-8 [Phoenix dactylifera]